MSVLGRHAIVCSGGWAACMWRAAVPDIHQRMSSSSRELANSPWQAESVGLTHFLPCESHTVPRHRSSRPLVQVKSAVGGWVGGCKSMVVILQERGRPAVPLHSSSHPSNPTPSSHPHRDGAHGSSL